MQYMYACRHTHTHTSVPSDFSPLRQRARRGSKSRKVDAGSMWNISMMRRQIWTSSPLLCVWLTVVTTTSIHRRRWACNPSINAIVLFLCLRMWRVSQWFYFSFTLELAGELWSCGETLFRWLCLICQATVEADVTSWHSSKLCLHLKFLDPPNPPPLSP